MALGVVMSEQKSVTMWTIVGANLVTAAILGVVAFATTIPSRLAASELEDCEATQAKAREELKKIYISEEAYRAEHDTYGSLPAIGRVPSASLPYDFVASPTFNRNGSGRQGFIARATGHGAMHRDEWVITEDNKFTNESNACRKE